MAIRLDSQPASQSASEKRERKQNSREREREREYRAIVWSKLVVAGKAGRQASKK